MFAKLSALALCVSFVSALTISATASVKVGDLVTIDVGAVVDDPTSVCLTLVGVDVVANIDLLDIVDVAATIDVTIPNTVLVGKNYVVAAVDVNDHSVIYAETDAIVVVSL